ncbi:hypothetical protein D3C73_1186960 [compost metagenome]
MYARQLALADGGPHQQGGHALAGRTHVVQGLRIGAVEVALVDDLAIHLQQYAADLLQFIAGNGVFQCLQARRVGWGGSAGQAEKRCQQAGNGQE